MEKNNQVSLPVHLEGVAREIEQAALRLIRTVKITPLELNKHYSKKFSAQIYFKREDLQEVRSFKIRGAFNKLSSLKKLNGHKKVVCASAGNHAQGVAFGCAQLKIKGVIFMPSVTPLQKIDRVKFFGGEFVEIRIKGANFDETNTAAQKYAKEIGAVYIHPFDDKEVIAGQGTIGREIFEQLNDVDIVFVPIGGGGLIGGIATYLKYKKGEIKIIGCEPLGAASMHRSIFEKKVTTLESIDTFVDGVAVKTPGNNTFALVKSYVERIIKVPEGEVASTMINLYQNEGIITEPAGALAIAALSHYNVPLKNKKIICIISGGNNDILRYGEILEKSLVYQGRKHYFIIQFAQKPGQLKKLLNDVLSPTDDIVRFEYIKKTNTEQGPALVGIEQKNKGDFPLLCNKLKKSGIRYQLVSPNDLLYRYII